MLLQASGIHKYYGSTPVLSGVSIQVQDRDRIGLVGANGAGKSTLLRILAGELAPDSGSVSRAKEVRIGYLEQNGGLQGHLSIQDEMLAAFGPLIEQEKHLQAMEVRMADPGEQADEHRYATLLTQYAELSDRFREAGGYEMNNRIRSVLHGMGFGDIAPDTEVSALSGGQRTRLALAKLLLVQPDLLLLDEPTNHLDIDTLGWLEQYLRTYAGAMIIVSHDRYFLDATAGTIVEIERHMTTRYTGNYSRYMEQKAADFERNVKLYEQQRKEIMRMEEFVQRNIARASTTRRAQSRRNALTRIERLEKPGSLRSASFSFASERRSGKEVLQLYDAAAAPDTSMDPLFHSVSMEIRRGERVALLGPNGIGKTTLLRALIGRLELHRGSVRWGAGVSIGYYDQEQRDLRMTNTVLEEVWHAFPRKTEAEIRTLLGNFLFSGEDVRKTIGALSGGEKARVALAKLMLKQANVLVLDEPTNHLDLMSREVLEAALEEYDGTMLFVSHDRYFLNRIADRIVELHPDGATNYLGNYDEMVQKKRDMAEWQAASQTKQDADPAPIPANDYEAEKQAKREARARLRKQEQLEADIERLEADIATLEEQMAAPENSTDYVFLREKQEALDELKPRLDEAYAEWETLMDE